MKHNQKGFSAIEVLVVFVIIGLVAGIGWYLMQSKDDKKPASASTNQTEAGKVKPYTDSSKLYSVQYPDSWLAQEDADCCEEAKDYTQVSRGVTFAPKDKAEAGGYGVRVQADRTDALAKNILQNWKDNKHEPEAKTINGHSAQYVKVAFKGDAENYIDHNYLVTHNGASVYMTFREKYYHQYPAENWSAASDLPAFNRILNSVAFLDKTQ